MRNILCAATLLFLSACAVGPDYRVPAVPTPVAFEGAADSGFSNNDVEREFWKLFGDPLLTQIIEDTLAANHDVRIAAAHLREVRALRGESRFDLAPTITASGGYTEARSSERQAPPALGIGRNQNYYDAGFDAAWELDLFGRVRRGIEARSAEVGAAVADLQNVEVTVTAEAARNYFELRGYQRQLDVAQRNADNQRKTLDLTKLRLDTGSGTTLDVARAQAQLSATLALIPEQEAAVARASFRISVLTGRSPEALVSQLAQLQPPPQLPQVQNIGTPEALLRRRPDVRAAERQLAAATAQIGVAIGDLFPRISLTGNWGYDATKSGELGQGSSENYAFGPVIRWAAFDLGRVRQQIKQRQAATQGALARYEQTVLQALEETDGSLVGLVKAVARQGHRRESAEASTVAAQLATARFEDGVSDFLTVLDAERSELEAQNQLVQSETATATALLSVYKALGGAFSTDAQAKLARD